jgi:hypothetical protein
MDLLLGILYYREYLYPLTTIVHHIFFICVSIGTIYIKSSDAFLGTFILEIPTLLLCIGTVWDNLRTDLIFGVLFFICRIVYHIYYIYRTYLVEAMIEGNNGLWWKILCCPLMLHFMWFSQWIKGALKRHVYGESKSKDGISTSDKNK